MHIHVYEDDRVDQLFPITTGRPAYAISCASYRLIDWLANLNGSLSGSVRPHLATHQELDFTEITSHHPVKDDLCLLVNARVVPSRSNIPQPLPHQLCIDFTDNANSAYYWLG